MRRLLFVLFFVSGFCGLLYQVVWTRMAFATFGIITPVLSIVLSVFMLGLSVGAWLGGNLIPVLVRKSGFSAVIFYAFAEFLIGAGAYAVPKLFASGEHILLGAGQMNSFSYLFLSALVLAFSIFPWCLSMGTTFPLMMAYIREQNLPDRGNFSFLYLANVLGAMSGTFLTAVVFIEVFGFQYTLQIAAAGNFTIALISGFLGMRQRRPRKAGAPEELPSLASPGIETARFSREPLAKWILFWTGFCALAMEVVWTRAFTPVLKNEVYSFALIVFAYLGATFIGSWWYRHHLKKNSVWPTAKLMSFLVVSAFLPIAAGDPRFVTMDWNDSIHLYSAIITLGSIGPLCALLGYLTPRLIDSYAQDDPTQAGKAYAINVFGCILGPLVASYLLLPQMSERLALVFLSLPFFVFYARGWKSLSPLLRLLSGLAACVITFYSLFFSQNFENLVSNHSKQMEVRRDYAASVISLQPTNGPDLLLVNGVGMTFLTPITKFMVDLPLTLHQGNSQSALIICFGMGTTYRSALSWGLDTTAVELIPDVPKTLGFYHGDAATVLSNPKGRIVIDDGRRFLKRSREKFDVIVVDPPPPIETAGSSLLYSTQFYDLVKQHLKPHGIFQIWYLGGETLTSQAVLRSAVASFPYVRCFSSIEGWGVHIIASMDPIVMQPAAQLAARMPPAATRDLLEWTPVKDPAAYLSQVLSREVVLEDCLNPNPEIQITDDDPLNEYFLLRRMGLF